MEKRKLLKIKRYVLKSSIWIAIVLYTISMCMVDSESWAPAFVCAGSLAWLCLIGWANSERGEER